MDRAGHVRRHAEPVQRNARNHHLGLGRQHGGFDLTRRHRVDPHAQRWANSAAISRVRAESAAFDVA